MEIKLTENGKEVVVLVNGVIDTVTAPELEKNVLPLCDKFDNIVLDLAGCDYMSSAGLRVVLVVAKSMAQKKFSLRNVCDTIYDVLVLTGFINILTVEA